MSETILQTVEFKATFHFGNIGGVWGQQIVHHTFSTLEGMLKAYGEARRRRSKKDRATAGTYTAEYTQYGWAEWRKNESGFRARHEAVGTKYKI